MQWKALFILLILGISLTEALIKKPRKFKKAKEQQKKQQFKTLEKRLELLQVEEADLEDQISEVLDKIDEESVKEVAGNIAKSYVPSEESEDEEIIKNPCQGIFCGAGRECIINEEGEGSCQCLETCNEADDTRRKVCSSLNDTWSSDCELYKMRCLCMEGSEKCSNKKFEHMHIDYYGNCQKLAECQPDEMSDFPRRMREWLFNIMRDMADREELSKHYMKMEEKAENDNARKWSIAAVWKWCELDGHPKDRSISRHELFPLRAPLYALEHCIAPFLNSCDPDDDHKISLKEWVTCLELSDEQIEDVEDFCEDIQD